MNENDYKNTLEKIILSDQKKNDIANNIIITNNSTWLGSNKKYRSSGKQAAILIVSMLLVYAVIFTTLFVFNNEKNKPMFIDESNSSQETSKIDGHQTSEQPTSTLSDISFETTSVNEVSYPIESITFYLPNKNADGFTTMDYECESTPIKIVLKLVEKGALPEGSELNSVETIQNFKKVIIDMNATFAAGITSSGSTKEYLYMGSLVNTLLEYYDADEITLTVAGKILETGHNIYDLPLTKFTSSLEPIKADFYVPNDKADGFNVFNYEYDGTMEGLIKKLIELGALPKNTVVNSFKVEKDTIKIDLSSAFGNKLMSTGTAGEDMLVGSLVNTLIKCYGVKTVSFTVNGSIVKTGHNVYDYPLSMFGDLTSSVGPIKADFYVPNDKANGFNVFNYEYDGTMEGLIKKLIELGALPKNTVVNSFKVEKDTIKIDLSSSFGNKLKSTGTAGEYMLVGSLVNTLIKCYGVKTVSFTVNGKIVETGHIKYDFAYSFFKNTN